MQEREVLSQIQTPEALSADDSISRGDRRKRRPRVGSYKALLMMMTLACLQACADMDQRPTRMPRGTRTPTTMVYNTGTPTLTESATPPPTHTPTPAPTKTETPTPTPDKQATNSAEIDRALEGEELELEDFKVQRVFVFDLPLTNKNLIFGLQTDKQGVTQVVVKNFDCQFLEAREQGLIGKEIDTGGIGIGRLFETDLVLEELFARRTGSLPNDVDVLTSDSFVFEGERTACAEQPLLQPVTNFVDQALIRIIDFVDSRTN